MAKNTAPKLVRARPTNYQGVALFHRLSNLPRYYLWRMVSEAEVEVVRHC
jgi:hypothetical protein